MPNFNAPNAKQLQADRQKYKDSADALGAAEREVQARREVFYTARAELAGAEARLKCCQEDHKIVAREFARPRDRFLTWLD